MKIKSRIIAFFFMLILSSCYSQTKKEEINGLWRGVKKELRDGNTGEKYTIDGKPYKVNFLLEFSDNGKVIDLVNHEEYTFKIDGNQLRIGKRNYIVEKLTAIDLVLLDYDVNNPNDPFAFRIYYKREQ